MNGIQSRIPLVATAATPNSDGRMSFLKLIIVLIELKSLYEFAFVNHIG